MHDLGTWNWQNNGGGISAVSDLNGRNGSDDGQRRVALPADAGSSRTLRERIAEGKGAAAGRMVAADFEPPVAASAGGSAECEAIHNVAFYPRGSPIQGLFGPHSESPAPAAARV
jgi:hypothetical protein